jgi:hypothetical protein
MASWWVNLGSTYKYEVKGFMWSPKTSNAGGRLQSYDNMTLMCPGDLVFAFVDSRIKAVGIVTSRAQDSPKPDFGSNGDYWSNDGWLVEVQFSELEKPLRVKNYMPQIGPTLPEKHSPLRHDGNANQAYLFALPDAMAVVLAGLIGKEYDDVFNQPLALDESYDESLLDTSFKMRLDISETQKLQLINARRGQGLFKANVRMVETSCRVTGVNQISMLRASHIKAWTKSDDNEKLSGFNGLLLSPHVDHLFDKGFITFESNGDMEISPMLELEVLERWKIPQIVNVGKFHDEQKPFLDFHREHHFKQSA